MARRYWLFKSEPETFSWDHLEAAPDRSTFWDGVRNYQARNLLRDEIRVSDGVLFYHSNAKPQVIMGTAIVVKAGAPDPSQFDARSKYFDPDATGDSPRWFGVTIQADRRFATPVSLPTLRETAGLEDMMVIKKGSRLSVQPVSADAWKIIVRLGAKTLRSTS
ncbi:MAG: EVE domain-containing protein [Deltaproteobacteria bacterium]|nr:EVE domain-containing protein [Deltaproteobacteria bacterium]